MSDPSRRCGWGSLARRQPISDVPCRPPGTRMSLPTANPSPSASLRKQRNALTRCARMRVRSPGLGETVPTPGTPSVVPCPPHLRKGWIASSGCDPATWLSRTLSRRYRASSASTTEGGFVARTARSHAARSGTWGTTPDAYDQRMPPTPIRLLVPTHRTASFDVGVAPATNEHSTLHGAVYALRCPDSGHPGVLFHGSTRWCRRRHDRKHS